MFTLLAWLVTLPLIIMAVAFALYNQNNITVVLNPFLPSLDLPLYVPVLVAIAFGFVFGSIMTWAAMGRLRQQKRRQAERIRTLEKEIMATKKATKTPSTGYQSSPFLMIGRR